MIDRSPSGYQNKREGKESEEETEREQEKVEGKQTRKHLESHPYVGRGMRKKIGHVACLLRLVPTCLCKVYFIRY